MKSQFRDDGDVLEPYTFTLLADGASANSIYLDVAAGVTVLILTGRYFEARAKRRSGAALRALLSMGAKDVAVLRSHGRQSPPGVSWMRDKRLRGP